MKKGRTVLEAKRFGVMKCDPQASLRQVAQLMADKQVSAIVVVDRDDHLAGVISRTDLLRAHLEHDDWATRPAGEYMSRDVVTVTTGERLREVAELLIEKKIHRVVVVNERGDKSKPLAVLSDTDLVYHMVQET